jgi:hypothetical protein
MNLNNQQNKGLNTATRLARMANWNNIVTDKSIVYSDFHSHSQLWEPNCHHERELTFRKDCSENIFVQIGNNGLCTREGPNRSKSVQNLLGHDY